MKKSQAGSALLMTVVILFALSIVITTCMSLAKIRLDIALVEKYTSNTYYIAKSALEQQVQQINDSLTVELPALIKALEESYIEQMISDEESKMEQAFQINKVSACSTKLDNKQLEEQLKIQIKKFITDAYLIKMKQSGVCYKLKGDREKNRYYTEIQITCPEGAFNMNSDQLTFVARVVTYDTLGNTYEVQQIQTTVKLEIDQLTHELNEKLEWRYDGHLDNQGELIYQTDSLPETLRGAVISFSDLGIIEGALKIEGDLYVKGEKMRVDDLESAPGTFLDIDLTGGVMVANGGKLEISGSLYCVNNVFAANEWNEENEKYNLKTSILVRKNIICNTLGIIDDFNEADSNLFPFADKKEQSIDIYVGGDVMVDNDVMIERFVKNGQIEVKHTIFGVSDGRGLIKVGSKYVSNPNTSSSIYCQGMDKDDNDESDRGTMISADRAFVMGQCYIDWPEESRLPMKLWESIGEPFDGVDSWEGYFEGRDDALTNKTYLSEASPFQGLVKRNKVKLTDITKSFAVASISAIDENHPNGVTMEAKSVLLNEINAQSFFYKGNTDYKMSQFTSNEEVDYTVADIALKQTVEDAPLYWGRMNVIDKEGGVYQVGKALAVRNNQLTNNLGLKGYMNYVRSIFYGRFMDKGRDDFCAELEQLSFDEVIDLKDFTQTHEWRYDTPITISDNGGVINISDFYVQIGDEESKPHTSIIMNVGEETLVLRADENQKVFNGMIISKGPIKFETDMSINGVVIVGGNAEQVTFTEHQAARMQGKQTSLDVNGKDIIIKANPQQVLAVRSKNQVLYKKILDTLGIINLYENRNEEAKMNYDSEYVVLSKDSTTEICIEKIGLNIVSLKKVY